VDQTKFWKATFAAVKKSLKEDDSDPNKLILVMGDFNVRFILDLAKSKIRKSHEEPEVAREARAGPKQTTSFAR